jgi:hypothetical protein
VVTIPVNWSWLFVYQRALLDLKPHQAKYMKNMVLVAYYHRRLRLILAKNKTFWMLVKRQNLYRNYLLSNHTKLDTIMFNKLQYISQGNTVEEQTRNIHQALDGGCKWVQLRFKTIFWRNFTLAEAAKFYARI